MLLPSNMVPLGTPLPDLELADLGGAAQRLDEIRADGILVVAFVCNHCPYVKHVEHGLGVLANEFAGRPVRFAAICSNDAEQYPDDNVSGLRNQKARADWRFPYLLDRDQGAALAFRAACTPDLFVFDSAGQLAYRGAFDESTPGNDQPVTGNLLRDALNRLLQGEAVPEPHRASMGCSIKWLPGNEPQ